MKPHSPKQPPAVPEHRPLIEGGSMPHENHIFEHETPRYREWLNEVDTMDIHFLRTRVKLILDALWATGDGNEESPRDIDPHAPWDDATDNVASALEDYIPPDPNRCTQCDQPNRQDQDGTEFPFCRECYSDDGSHCPAGDPTCEQFANDTHDTCEAPKVTR